MNNELFGVFDGRPTFDAHRPSTEFDRIVEGPSLTVGIRDPGLTESGWTHCVSDGRGACIIWGESYHPEAQSTPADEVLTQYPAHGLAAFSKLNGSYVAVIDDGDDPVVVGDPIRTRECFYTDAGTPRVFGTDHESVASAVDVSGINRQAIREYLHMSVVMGDRTIFDGVDRIPFDAALTPTDTTTLDRFVYDSQEFDYVDSLARRLRRAIDRRTPQPGRSGVLLSAGYDSRVLLTELPDIKATYTIGDPDSDEVAAAQTLATSFDVDHDILDPTEGYLNTGTDSVQYGQAVNESLQAHPAIDDETMAVDSVYHGLLFDTLFTGHFRPERSVDLFEYTIPLPGMATDPDIVHELLVENFGYWDLYDHPAFDGFPISASSRSVCRDAISAEYERLAHRFETDADAVAAIGIANQPTLPFHTYLADTYFTPFVAADRELIEWHLRTPPEHRTPTTYRRALERIDSDVLTPRPPDRPHARDGLNHIENFVRQAMPGVESVGAAWPDRRDHYDRTDVDAELFGETPELQALPTRVKLRFNDVRSWVESVEGDQEVAATDIVAWFQPS